MKKVLILSATVLAALTFASCGSSKETAYRKAYEKAKAQVQADQDQPVQQDVAGVAQVVRTTTTYTVPQQQYQQEVQQLTQYEQGQRAQQYQQQPVQQYQQQPVQQYQQQPVQQYQQQPVQQYQQQPVQQQPVQQQQYQQQPVQQQQYQQPVQQQQYQQQPVQQPSTRNDVAVRQENLTVVNGDGLKAFSVVVGAFGSKSNAENLQRTLINAGYRAQVAYNEERQMYRVIASTFESKDDAANSRDQLVGQYPGAWILGK